MPASDSDDDVRVETDQSVCSLTKYTDTPPKEADLRSTLYKLGVVPCIYMLAIGINFVSARFRSWMRSLDFLDVKNEIISRTGIVL